MAAEEARSPDGPRLNVSSGSRRFNPKMLNLGLFLGRNVDIQGDLIHLPIKDESVDTIVCTGVLEHVSDPHKAVEEIYRALSAGERSFWRHLLCKHYMLCQKISIAGHQKV